MTDRIARRRFIGITAAAAGLALLPLGGRARAEASVVTWQGAALGAAATLQIHHHDRAAAERLVSQAIAEIHRLEGLFSLYRGDSALVELNLRGVLDAPASEMVELLGEARGVYELTGGVFDPTIQPLWALYANHFSRPGAAPDGPPPDELRAALAKVDYRQVLLSRDRIGFGRRGMALTLNGIAQGYITDKVVELLRSGGIEHSLVDMGESRALGHRSDGRPWTVGLADPDHPERIADTVPLVDRAVATSGQSGFRFDRAGRFNHLLDPATGRSASRYRSVTVIMPTATAADALSTAFSLMPVEAIGATLKTLRDGEARIILADGQRTIVSA
jgi:thiamine biosynthesis lipoprotein